LHPCGYGPHTACPLRPTRSRRDAGHGYFRRTNGREACRAPLRLLPGVRSLSHPRGSVRLAWRAERSLPVRTLETPALGPLRFEARSLRIEEPGGRSRRAGNPRAVGKGIGRVDGAERGLVGLHLGYALE